MLWKAGVLIMSNIDRIKWYIKNIDLIKFVKYNFFSKNIIREGKSYLRPYKHAVIDIDKSAKIYLKGKCIDIGINKLKGSKAETYLRMSKGAVWHSNNGCSIYYGADLEIKENATFTSGFFTANTGSTIICTLDITLGDDVMMGRYNLIYDSDFHSILGRNDQPRNFNRPIKIGDHVWITSNVTVLKGVTIGNGCIVSSTSTVTTDLEPGVVAQGGSGAKAVFKGVKWSRKYPGRKN